MANLEFIKFLKNIADKYGTRNTYGYVPWREFAQQFGSSEKMSRLNVINKYIQRLFRSQDDDYTSIITPFFPVNTPEGRESPFYSLLNQFEMLKRNINTTTENVDATKQIEQLTSMIASWKDQGKLSSIQLPFIYFDYKKRKFVVDIAQQLGGDRPMQYNYFHQGYYDIKITDVLFGRIRGENVEFRAANELGTNANDWLKDQYMFVRLNLRHTQSGVEESILVPLTLTESEGRNFFKDIVNTVFGGIEEFMKQSSKIYTLSKQLSEVYDSGRDLKTFEEKLASEGISTTIRNIPQTLSQKEKQPISAVALKKQVQDAIKRSGISVYSLDEEISEKAAESIQRQIYTGQTPEQLRLITPGYDTQQYNRNIQLIAEKYRKLTGETDLSAIQSNVQRFVHAIGEEPYRQASEITKQINISYNLASGISGLSTQVDAGQYIINDKDLLRSLKDTDYLKRLAQGYAMSTQKSVIEELSQNVGKISSTIEQIKNSIISSDQYGRTMHENIDLISSYIQAFKNYRSQYSKAKTVGEKTQYYEEMKSLYGKIFELQQAKHEQGKPLRDLPIMEDFLKGTQSLEDILKAYPQIDYSLFSTMLQGDVKKTINSIVGHDIEIARQLNGITQHDQQIIKRSIYKQMLTREFTSEELAKLVEQAFKTEVPNNRSIDTLISALMTNKINVDEIGDLRLKTIHGFVQSIDDNVLQQISKVLKQQYIAGNESSIVKGGTRFVLSPNEIVKGIYQVMAGEKNLTIGDVFGYPIYELISNVTEREDIQDVFQKYQNVLQAVYKVQFAIPSVGNQEKLSKIDVASLDKYKIVQAVRGQITLARQFEKMYLTGTQFAGKISQQELKLVRRFTGNKNWIESYHFPYIEDVFKTMSTFTGIGVLLEARSARVTLKGAKSIGRGGRGIWNVVRKKLSSNRMYNKRIEPFLHIKRQTEQINNKYFAPKNTAMQKFLQAKSDFIKLNDKEKFFLAYMLNQSDDEIGKLKAQTFSDIMNPDNLEEVHSKTATRLIEMFGKQQPYKVGKLSKLQYTRSELFQYLDVTADDYAGNKAMLQNTLSKIYERISNNDVKGARQIIRDNYEVFEKMFAKKFSRQERQQLETAMMIQSTPYGGLSFEYFEQVLKNAILSYNPASGADEIVKIVSNSLFPVNWNVGRKDIKDLEQTISKLINTYYTFPRKFLDKDQEVIENLQKLQSYVYGLRPFTFTKSGQRRMDYVEVLNRVYGVFTDKKFVEFSNVPMTISSVLNRIYAQGDDEINLVPDVIMKTIYPLYGSTDFNQVIKRSYEELNELIDRDKTLRIIKTLGYKQGIDEPTTLLSDLLRSMNIQDISDMDNFQQAVVQKSLMDVLGFTNINQIPDENQFPQKNLYHYQKLIARMFKRDQNIGYISKNPQLALYYIRYLQELTGVDLTVKTIKSIMKRTGLQIPAGDLSFKMVRERIRDNRGRTKIRHKLVASGARTTQQRIIPIFGESTIKEELANIITKRFQSKAQLINLNEEFSGVVTNLQQMINEEDQTKRLGFIKSFLTNTQDDDIEALQTLQKLNYMFKREKATGQESHLLFAKFIDVLRYQKKMQNQDAAAAFVEDTMNRYALELENMFGDLGLSSLRSERLIEILREVLPQDMQASDALFQKQVIDNISIQFDENNKFNLDAMGRILTGQNFNINDILRVFSDFKAGPQLNNQMLKEFGKIYYDQAVTTLFKQKARVQSLAVRTMEEYSKNALSLQSDVIKQLQDLDQLKNITATMPKEFYDLQDNLKQIGIDEEVSTNMQFLQFLLRKSGDTENIDKIITATTIHGGESKLGFVNELTKEIFGDSAMYIKSMVDKLDEQDKNLLAASINNVMEINTDNMDKSVAALQMIQAQARQKGSQVPYELYNTSEIKNILDALDMLGFREIDEDTLVEQINESVQQNKPFEEVLLGKMGVALNLSKKPEKLSEVIAHAQMNTAVELNEVNGSVLNAIEDNKIISLQPNETVYATDEMFLKAVYDQNQQLEKDTIDRIKSYNEIVQPIQAIQKPQVSAEYATFGTSSQTQASASINDKLAGQNIGARKETQKVDVEQQLKNVWNDIEQFVKRHPVSTTQVFLGVTQLQVQGTIVRQKAKNDAEELKKVIHYNDYKSLPPIVNVSHSTQVMQHFYAQQMQNQMYQNSIRNM